jgi:hypothetical protein
LRKPLEKDIDLRLKGKAVLRCCVDAAISLDFLEENQRTVIPFGGRMTLNRAWINIRMDEGYTIIDLGPSPNYANYPYIRSEYYAMELVEIAARDYSGWLPIWGVFD